MRFFVGLLLIAMGFVLLWKRQWFVHTFPASAFAQRWFGNMYSFYAVVGVGLMLLGLVWVTGLPERALRSILVPSV